MSIILIMCNSCVSHKNLTYLDEIKEGKTYESYLENYKVMPGDMLDISIKNPDPDQVEIFLNEGTNSGTVQMGGATVYLRSYIVDDSGRVEIPLAGKVKVSELELSQINDTIHMKLNNYLNHITVSTKLLSFRITVLGEVKSPGTQYIYSPNINIYQALGLAGDITDLGNKNKVKVIRTENYESKAYVIDLNSSNILTSKVYFVKPNDIIYVEPLKAKAFRMNSSSIAFAISILTLTITIYNLVRK